MKPIFTLTTLLIPLAGALPISHLAAQGPSDVTAQQVSSILEKHCVMCHGPQKQEGELTISKLDPDIVNGADAEYWQEMLDRLNAGTMPPKGRPNLLTEELDQLTAWLTGQLKLAAKARQSSGGRTTLRRLTRYEYNNTLRDLLGLDLDFAQDLPPEGAAEFGFQNNSNVLVTSVLHLDYFQKIAKRALEMALGPKKKPVPFELTIEPGKKGVGEKNTAIGNDLQPSLAANDVGELKFSEFPIEGSVMIRITAWASPSSRGNYPFRRVELGRQGKKNKTTKLVAEIGVEAVRGAPRAYEFQVQAENYPLTGVNGLPYLLEIRNQFDPGTADLAAEDYPILHITKVELVHPCEAVKAS